MWIHSVSADHVSFVPKILSLQLKIRSRQFWYNVDRNESVASTGWCWFACPLCLLTKHTVLFCHLLWFLFKGPHVTKSDLSLLQLIKAGKEGVFYQARMTRGTCKGHNMFTCKISKEGILLIINMSEVKVKVHRQRTTI